jgi:hypothetical protein
MILIRARSGTAVATISSSEFGSVIAAVMSVRNGSARGRSSSSTVLAGSSSTYPAPRRNRRASSVLVPRRATSAATVSRLSRTGTSGVRRWYHRPLRTHFGRAGGTTVSTMAWSRGLVRRGIKGGGGLRLDGGRYASAPTQSRPPVVWPPFTNAVAVDDPERRVHHHRRLRDRYRRNTNFVRLRASRVVAAHLGFVLAAAVCWVWTGLRRAGSAESERSRSYTFLT